MSSGSHKRETPAVEDRPRARKVPYYDPNEILDPPAARPSETRNPRQVKLDISTSPDFKNWLAEQNTSLAFTTGPGGKLIFAGLGPNNQPSFFNRALDRCKGLTSIGNKLAVSTLYQIFEFVDVAATQPLNGDHDALYVPQIGYTTGEVDARDVTYGNNGEIYFVNTLFNCIATASRTHSFKPVWKPAFVDQLVAEDRCHLNGMAFQNDQPRFATAAAESNAAAGWHEHRSDGGVLIEVETNQVILRGLSLPHSPRLYNGHLWLLDSGSGYFGFVDVNAQKFVPVTFCPGYLRGLIFINNFAIAGLSKPRSGDGFNGLQLQENLDQKNTDASCGLVVIDLSSGDIVHWLKIEGLEEEVFDVAALPGRRNPMAVGFQNDQIRRVISIETQ